MTNNVFGGTLYLTQSVNQQRSFQSTITKQYKQYSLLSLLMHTEHYNFYEDVPWIYCCHSDSKHNSLAVIGWSCNMSASQSRFTSAAACYWTSLKTWVSAACHALSASSLWPSSWCLFTAVFVFLKICYHTITVISVSLDIFLLVDFYFIILLLWISRDAIQYNTIYNLYVCMYVCRFITRNPYSLSSHEACKAYGAL